MPVNLSNSNQLFQRLTTGLTHCALMAMAWMITATGFGASSGIIAVGDVALSVTTVGLVGQVSLHDGSVIEPVSPKPIARLISPRGDISPVSAQLTSDSLAVKFADGSRAKIAVAPGPEFTLFRLESLDLKSSVTNLRLLRIPVPPAATINRTLNAAFFDDQVIALMSASPEITVPGAGSSRRLDLQGCSHIFTQTTDARSGRFAAKFAARCGDVGAGWSMSGSNLKTTVPLQQIAGLSAWIHGDGKGQHLKFQLIDEKGGARDYYVPINFEGWRRIEMTTPALDITTGERLTGLNLYYNSHPANAEVECLIDDISILMQDDPAMPPVSISLEDFEDTTASWWSDDSHVLQLDWDLRFAGVGETVGVIAAAEASFFDVVEKFEKAAEILVPYPDDHWNKRAPATKESYLFLTAFSEAQFDEALHLAKLGGFKHVLILQNSWCHSTGHYEVNLMNFPDGLSGLVRTVNRFREHGIKVGFHLLAASVDNNDPYITPVPDPRLFKDAETILASALDAHTTTIAVQQMPDGFPSEDGGYYGNGTVLQIGDELIHYVSRTTTAPYTFIGCTRGHLGTGATAHPAGETVHHLARAYGYHMFDMDTSLLDEITSNFARIANACDIDMVYFDGAENLQGHHGRYNSRLINAFLSKLDRKDILVQASSFTHFSWHQLARSASADGHGDLKGYLEERAPSFSQFRRMGMPLDIGWYYGYDKMATPDMYEYILGTTLGYDSSFSYQVSVSAARAHPFTGDILRLIKIYEELRASRRVPEDMRERLKVADELLGKSPEDPNRPLHARRDYRLITSEDSATFQRVIYGEWQTGDTPSSGTQWHVNLTTGPVDVGMQIHVLPAASGGEQNSDATGEHTLINPQVEITVDTNGQSTVDGGSRARGDVVDQTSGPVQILKWEGSLPPGQYLTLWPGEQPEVRGPDAAASMNPAPPTAPGLMPTTHKLPHAPHTAHFTAKTPTQLRYRVRLIYVTQEQHELRH